MRIYTVGGAVRDKLLKRPAGDRDYVVVGATVEQMQRLGYRPVGKDFPVFLHPQTSAEYALARTERKTGHGYHGFAFHADPQVTLEQDLLRRDLTINAIAEDDAGQLIDPYGGVRDLQQRVLRHVSPAFVEDPVRVLRVARFAARFAPLGFTLANETMALMRAMVDNGEVDHLAPERVWTELRRALGEAQPSAFLRTLRACGALHRLLPEVDALYGVPQRAQHHPEIDTGTHLEMVLDMAARLAPGDDLVGYCALVHDLGKALTPANALPRHAGHEQAGIKPLHALCARLRVPNEYATLAEVVCRDHTLVHRVFELEPATILKLLTAVDALRRPQRLETVLRACEADSRGRLGHAEDAYPQADFLRAARIAVARVTAESFVTQGLRGPAIGAAMEQARQQAIAQVIKSDDTSKQKED